jgi:hypothetical protein
MVHKWSLKVSDGLANLRVKFNDEYIPISAETSEPRLNADYLQKVSRLSYFLKLSV